jgi:DmsE family decaheme c-type cytochrome
LNVEQGIRMRIGSVLAALFLLGVLGSAQAAKDADASAPCLACHEGELTQKMAKTAHGFVTDARTPSCVSCHGTSEAHASDPTEKKPDRGFTGASALPAFEASAVCLSCHQKERKRALWAGSQHPEAGVPCTGCHKIHSVPDKTLAKSTQPGVCYTCHKAQRAVVNLPSRHAIAEGQIACSDCHNVHGSAGPKLVKRDSTNDTCFLCHADKRGPFVHPHQPVAEDCSLCHNPHGSTVAGMLKVRAPILCNQCHTPHVAGGVGALGGQPGVFPPPTSIQGSSAVTPTSNGKNVVNIWQARACMNCHTQVHGSNNPSATNPTPQYQFR